MVPRQLRPARRGDLPQLIELWMLAFGDESSFVEDFFQTVCPLEQVLVAAQGGHIQAMLSLLPLQWKEAGVEREVAYVYALTTHQDGRGRGHAHALLDYAAQVAGQRGFAGICTVPARPELHPFFASAGYEEGLVTCRELCLRRDLLHRSAAGTLCPVAPEEYGAIREERLRGLPHAAYSPGLLSFQARQGTLYALDLPGGRGCMALERGETGVILKELLLPAGEGERALSLLADACPAEHYELRTPAGRGEPWAFGMGRWFAPEGPQGRAITGYLGLAFD